MYPDHPNGSQPQVAPQVPGSTAYQTVTPPPGGYDAPSAIYRPKKKSYIGIIVSVVLIIAVVVGGIVGFLAWDKAQQQEARRRAEAAKAAAEAAKPKIVTVLLNQKTAFDKTTKLELPTLPSGWREISSTPDSRTVGNPATSELLTYGVAHPIWDIACKTDYECTQSSVDVAEQSLAAQPNIKNVKRAKQDTVTIQVSDTKKVELAHAQFTYTQNGITKVMEWYKRLTAEAVISIEYTRDARAADTSTKIVEQFVMKGSV